MRTLTDEVVIVTGAGTGIGARIAVAAAAEGAKLLLLGRTPGTLEATASRISDAGGTALCQRCDVTEQGDIDAAIDAAMSEWGRIDGLVNNAGIFVVAHSLMLQRSDWDSVLATDLSAAFFMSQAAGRVMARAGSGSIINIASVDGHAAEPLAGPYNVAKAGLYGVTRTLALDLGPLGVRCNSVSPGYVEGTAMAEDTAETGSSLSQLLKDWQRVPTRRMVAVDEVARTCIFLLSRNSAGITGSDVVIDGGLLSNLYALDSVPGTGWTELQSQTFEEVRASLGIAR